MKRYKLEKRSGWVSLSVSMTLKNKDKLFSKIPRGERYLWINKVVAEAIENL